MNFSLEECTPEELFMLEQTISTRPDAERQFRPALDHISELIMTCSARLGETVHMNEFEHEVVIPLQRQSEEDREHIKRKEIL